jgi:hypothetical protein
VADLRVPVVLLSPGPLGSSMLLKQPWVLLLRFLLQVGGWGGEGRWQQPPEHDSVSTPPDTAGHTGCMQTQGVGAILSYLLLHVSPRCLCPLLALYVHKVVGALVWLPQIFYTM